MKKALFGATIALAAGTFVGCASTELTESQKVWVSDTEALIEAQDPELRQFSRTGIAAIDAVADSITAMSILSIDAMTNYMYEQDAKSCWESYARWATDAEAGKLSQENDWGKYLQVASAESRFRCFPTVLKRNSTNAEEDVKKLVDFDNKITPKDGEDVLTEGAPRDVTKEIVDANLKPITIWRKKQDEKTGKTVYKTVFGGQAVLDNEEAFLNRLGKKLLQGEEAPVTFTYIPEGIPTKSDTIPCTITVTENEQQVVVENPAYTKLKARAKDKLVTVKNADGVDIEAYETFVVEDKYVTSYVSNDGLYDVKTNTVVAATEKQPLTGANGEINKIDSLLIDELTGRPVPVKDKVLIDLPVALVKRYESLQPLMKKIVDAKDEETRKAAEKEYEAAAEAACDAFLEVMAVEGMDWSLVLEVLTEKLVKATADAQMLAMAVQQNGKVIAGLTMAAKFKNDASAAESLESLNRIRRQSAMAVKLLPHLIGVLKDKIVE
jgi:hypothetical protein